MNEMPYLVAPPARSRRLVGRLSHCMMLSMADDRQLSSQSLPACLIRPGCQPGYTIPAASSLGRFQPSSCNIVRGASSSRFKTQRHCARYGASQPTNLVLELTTSLYLHMLWIDVPKDMLQRLDRIDQQRDLGLHRSLSQKFWSIVALSDTSVL